MTTPEPRQRDTLIKGGTPGAALDNPNGTQQTIETLTMKRTIHILLMVAALALSACSGKYEEWYAPQDDRPTPTTVTFTADSVAPIDLRLGTGDSVRIFRPSIGCDKPYTVSYQLMVFNHEHTDSLMLRAYGNGRALREAVQQALTTLYGPADVRRDLSMNITASITVEGTIYRGHADSIPLIVTPRREQLAPVWYIMGNHVGSGKWDNSPTGLYSSLIPLYADPQDYRLLTYAGYFPQGTEFRIVPTVGSENYIGGGDETGGQSFQDETMEGDPLDNVIVSRAGYYRITVDVTHASAPVMHMERLSDDESGREYSQLSIVDPATAFAAVTTAAGGRSHDWMVSQLSLPGRTAINIDGTYSVPADTTGLPPVEVRLGGYAFPAGRTVAGSQGIDCPEGTYTVLYNDLLGVYRFIAQ